MLKQLLTVGSIFALLLVGSLPAGARTEGSVLLSQTQEVPPTTTTPAGSSVTNQGVDDSAMPSTPEDSITSPDAGSSTTPAPADSMTSPVIDDSSMSPNQTTSRAEACENIPPPSPTAGGTKERLDAIEDCNEATRQSSSPQY